MIRGPKTQLNDHLNRIEEAVKAALDFAQSIPDFNGRQEVIDALKGPWGAGSDKMWTAKIKLTSKMEIMEFDGRNIYGPKKIDEDE